MPRVAAVTGSVGRWPTTTTALPKIGSMRPGDGNAWAREEEKVRASTSSENEGERELLWAWVKR